MPNLDMSVTSVVNNLGGEWRLPRRAAQNAPTLSYCNRKTLVDNVNALLFGKMFQFRSGGRRPLGMAAHAGRPGLRHLMSSRCSCQKRILLSPLVEP